MSAIIEEPLRILKGHTDFVWDVAFSPDGQTLASSSWDGTVRLWQVTGGSSYCILEGYKDNWITRVAFSPNEQTLTLALGSLDGKVMLWRSRENTPLHVLGEHTAAVSSMAFSPNGEILASGSGDQTIRLWRVGGGLLHTLEGHTGLIWDVVFSSDGRTLVSGSADCTVRLWRVAKGTLKQTLLGHGDRVRRVFLSPNGRTLVSVSTDRTVRLWRRGGVLQHTLEEPTSIWGAAFSPNGQVLALGAEDATVWLWRVTDGALLCVLKGYAGRMSSVAFSPDGRMLASGAGDGTVHLWQIADIASACTPPWVGNA